MSDSYYDQQFRFIWFDENFTLINLIMIIYSDLFICAHFFPNYIAIQARAYISRVYYLLHFKRVFSFGDCYQLLFLILVAISPGRKELFNFEGFGWIKTQISN